MSFSRLWFGDEASVATAAASVAAKRGWLSAAVLVPRACPCPPSSWNTTIRVNNGIITSRFRITRTHRHLSSLIQLQFRPLSTTPPSPHPSSAGTGNRSVPPPPPPLQPPVSPSNTTNTTSTANPLSQGKAATPPPSAEQIASLMRSVYWLGMGTLLLVLFTYWNTSVASTATILLHEETKSAFNQLAHMVHQEHEGLRRDVTEMAQTALETKEKSLKDLDEIKKEILALLVAQNRPAKPSANPARMTGSYSPSSFSSASAALSSLAAAVGLKDKTESPSTDGDVGPTSASDADSGSEPASASSGLPDKNEMQRAWEDGFLAGIHAQILCDAEFPPSIIADRNPGSGSRSGRSSSSSTSGSGLPQSIKQVPGVHSEPPRTEASLPRSASAAASSQTQTPSPSRRPESHSEYDAASPAASEAPVDNRYQGALTSPPSAEMGKPPIHTAGRDDPDQTLVRDQTRRR